MRFLKTKIQKKNKKPFSRIEKRFGDFLDVAKHFSTTQPGVSQKCSPHPKNFEKVKM